MTRGNQVVWAIAAVRTPNLRRAFSGLVVTILLSACASDRGTFVTFTGLGLNTHPTNPALSIAYDRFDGFAGPIDPDGSMPSVYSWIDSNGELFDRKVRQVYATGKAAETIAREFGKNSKSTDQVTGSKGGVAPNGGGDTVNASKSGASTTTGVASASNTETLVETQPPADPNSTSNRRLGYFATGTVYGIKLGLSTIPAGVPVEFTVGVRRQELSGLPLDGAIEDYPITVAAFDLNAEADAGGSQGTAAAANTQADAQATTGSARARYGSVQFFASGGAAQTLAENPQFQSIASAPAEKSLLTIFDKAVATQADISSDILRCYASLPPASRQTMRDDAIARNLIAAARVRLLMRSEANASLSDAEKAAFADAQYAGGVSSTEGLNMGRAFALDEHRKKVCAASGATLQAIGAKLTPASSATGH